MRKWSNLSLTTLHQALGTVQRHNQNGFHTFTVATFQLRYQNQDMVQLFVGHGIGFTTKAIEKEGGSDGYFDISWDLNRLCKDGRLKEAMDALHIMDHGGIQIGSITYACLLQACVNRNALADGKRVHVHMIKSGSNPNIFVENNLVNMYAKCGSVVNARQVFDKMATRNVFTWNSMITGYAKCGSIQLAHQLFDEMPEQDLVSWNVMIAGYAQYGNGKEALNIFLRMQKEGVKPDRITFTSVLNACVSRGALERGKQIHTRIITAGLESSVVVGSALVDMYAKCESMEYARQVFDNMSERNVVSWTAMILGYIQNGHGEEALKFFCQMICAGLTPDQYTFVIVLSACASLAALEHGKQVMLSMGKAKRPSISLIKCYGSV